MPVGGAAHGDRAEEEKATCWTDGPGSWRQIAVQGIAVELITYSTSRLPSASEALAN